jgi:hypothetical protein
MAAGGQEPIPFARKIHSRDFLRRLGAQIRSQVGDAIMVPFNRLWRESRVAVLHKKPVEQHLQCYAWYRLDGLASMRGEQFKPTGSLGLQSICPRLESPLRDLSPTLFRRAYSVENVSPRLGSAWVLPLPHGHW